MYKRSCKFLEANSFFLFGARGTGKSTLLSRAFEDKSVLWIDLLKPEEENTFLLHPETLTERLDALECLPEWVVIDEVQKAPKLLDVIHREIETRAEARERKLKFALTGSSARKLKRGASNLLAGRAFTNNLYPLTHIEIGDAFSLEEVLHWGALPFHFQLESKEEKRAFLESYVNTYLKEEVIQEQLIRNTTPFRKFLPVAAQVSGTIVNFNRIADDLGVDWSTVKNYFEILEDTLLGFSLPSFTKSVRKQQLKASKFYLFDIGVQRAMTKSLTVPLQTGQQIGPPFEHFILCEIVRLNDYFRKDYSLSYLTTQGGLEVDLIIERPGEKDLLVEIQSFEQVTEQHIKHVKSLLKESNDFEAICISREPSARKQDGVLILPWREAFQYLNLVS
jgi:predicted AAA+ superfamily ATPase